MFLAEGVAIMYNVHLDVIQIRGVQTEGTCGTIYRFRLMRKSQAWKGFNLTLIGCFSELAPVG